MKLIIISLIFLTVVSLSFLKFSKFNNFAATDTRNSTSKPGKTAAAKIVSPDELLEKIEKEMAPLGGTYSFFVVSIKDKSAFGADEETVFKAASVNKIAILAALYHLAGKKEIDLEKTITLQKGDVQDYGTGSIRYDPPGSVYSVRTLARLMMQKSDNTAAYILAKMIVGTGKIQELIDKWALTQTNMEENLTSAKDMGTLLIKMFTGEITTQALTSEMLGFMDKSDFEDRIPKELPSEVKVYHKTGDEIGKIHDAAIVNLNTKPYYLGIFTTDMTDEEETKKTMAKISRMIFDYFKGS